MRGETRRAVTRQGQTAASLAAEKNTFSAGPEQTVT